MRFAVLRRGRSEGEVGARPRVARRTVPFERPSEGFDFRLEVEVVERKRAPAQGIGNCQRAIDDGNTVEADVCLEGRRVRQGRQGAIAPERQPDRRLLQPRFHDLELAVKQRGDRQLQVEVADPERDRPVIAADHHLVKDKVGCRQELEVDGAPDRHLLSEGARQPSFDESALAVPIDEIRRGERGRQSEDQKDGKRG